jgi:SIR2-like domain
MPNVILLLGAGFSKNWNGLLATEVTEDLTSRLQSDSGLCDLLNSMNFEDALSKLQTDFLLLARSRSDTLQEARLTAFEAALSAVFDRMNKHFQSLPQFEFSNEVSSSFRKFLTGFDAIFTLNQDLLLELHYHRREDVTLWHGTRWQGGEMPGLHASVTNHHNRAFDKWYPEPPFTINPNLQPYFKLHGSSGWFNVQERLLVVGREKTATINSRSILQWNYQQFEKYLNRDDTRLMVIGYGFGDDHINQSVLDAHRAGKLKLIYLVQPSGKETISNKCPDLLKVSRVECTIPISTAFNGDDLARERMQRIFQ